jgi:Zn-dependent peptidase ImmA (M78 family)/transcriptional regulator with XRE-family HTH domain
MPRQRIEINVEPKLLLWARETIGKSRSEVASKLKVSEKTIEGWESGQSKPSLTQAETLSRLYKRPLAAFFLPEPPKEQPHPQDFRTMSSKQKTEFSSSMLLVIRRARRLQGLATELAQNGGRDLSLKLPAATLYDDPEVLATKLRNQLGVSTERQTSIWKNERQALEGWKMTVEGLGILVQQIGMPLDEARGFSLVGDGIPVIVLNARDAVRAQIFSLFHECAHLMLNNFGVCDMKEGKHISAEAGKVEQFCNHFAGALLLPRSPLQTHPLVSTLRPNGRLSDESLAELSVFFKVSQEAILRRLVMIGKASREWYDSKRIQWQREFKKQKGGRSNPPKKCVRENGLTFVSLVLDAFREERITYRDAADYLTVRVKHLPKVEQLVGEMAYSNEATI